MAAPVTRATAARRAGGALVAAVLLLAGCTGRVGVVTMAPSQPPHTSPPPTVGTTTANQAAARVEADRIITTFRPPVGAVRLAGRPAGADLPAYGVAGPGAADMVDRTGWWQAPGPATSVLAWITAHAPRGTTSGGTSESGDPGPRSYGVEYDWPPAAPLQGRQLLVTVSQSRTGTVIRVDAQVTYLPARPAASLVPPAATALSVRMVPFASGPSLTPSRKRYGPTEVTDPSRVAAVVALVNEAPMELPAMRFCPLMIVNGGDLSITFTAGAGGPTVATATITFMGCQGLVVTVTVTGTAPVALQGDTSTANRIIDLLGLGWPHQP